MVDFANTRRVTKISPSIVKAYLPRLGRQLGEKDQERLARTLELFEDNSELPLSQALVALFEDKPLDEQLMAFRQWRSRLAEAADASGVPLRLTTDTRKRTPPAYRRCWFIGSDFAAADALAPIQQLVEETKYVPAMAVRGKLDNIDTQTPDQDARDRLPVLDLLDTWLNAVDQPRYGALLGEVGIGKTTTCMYWTHYLSERRSRDANAPLPIYFDLRAIAAQAAVQHLTTTLESSLQMLIDANPLLDLTPRDVIHRVQNEGAVVIFDGLDEVFVHMLPATEQAFVRQLKSILPPIETRGPPGKPLRPGRVLMTCRTHYFRTLRDQDAFMFAEQPKSARSQAFAAFLLLPFSEQQVRQYLRQTIPPDDVDPFLEFIGRVHNLSELAARPLLLGLISEQVQTLEQLRLRNGTVNGAKLYENFVQSWLDRDRSKHRILPEHKQLFMERLAAQLSRDRHNGWAVDSIDQWLVELLTSKPEIKAHYPDNPIELLKEDLRTATFIVREGEDHFRFAHTSLQEFFLACHLKRALIEQAYNRWDKLLSLSDETLNFFGQLLQIAPTYQCEQALAAFRHLRNNSLGHATLLAFRYGLIAHDKDYPVSSLAGFQLQNADLRGLKIAGTEQQRLNLDQVCFANAKLDGASFYRVSLEDADFNKAELDGTEFRECRLVAATLLEAKLIGTVFRDCNVSEARFTGARLHRTQWVRCELHQVSDLPLEAPAAFFAECIPRTTLHTTRPPQSVVDFDVFDGHLADIKSAVFSPDGRHVLSGSVDALLKLWDSATGECLRTMQGHEGAINSVAFSPDGLRLLSGSADGTLRVWNALSGECSHVLTDHRGAINCVAFSPNGECLLSASDDRSLKLWNSANGECLRSMHGHEGKVTSTAFSPDGSHILSGACDKTIRLWDVATALCLRKIEVSSDVSSVAFSQHKKARRVLSGSHDSRLHLWDAVSGQRVHELPAAVGHVSGVAFSCNGEALICGWLSGDLVLRNAITGDQLFSLKLDTEVNGVAFSPDGKRVLAAVGDRIEVYSEAGTLIRKLCSHAGCITAVNLSPDGRYFLCRTGDGKSLLLDLVRAVCLSTADVDCASFVDEQREPLHRHDNGQVDLLTFDGNTPTRETLPLGKYAASVAHSPNDARALIGQLYGSVAVWDIDARKCLGELKLHSDIVTGLAFSPDGTLAVSVSREGIAKVWDISGNCLHTLPAPMDDTTTVKFLPDGRQVMIAGAAEVAFWELQATASPREVLRVRSFGSGSFAWWRPGEIDSLKWTGEAWRWLGVLVRDRETGATERYPIEAFVRTDPQHEQPLPGSLHEVA